MGSKIEKAHYLLDVLSVDKMNEKRFLTTSELKQHTNRKKSLESILPESRIEMHSHSFVENKHITDTLDIAHYT